MCSGWFKLEDKDWTLMARYLRPGVHLAPFDPSKGFYSFVEDWNRGNEAKGHEVMRRAKFFGQKLRLNCGDEVAVSNAAFTKVETGLDKYASDKVKATSVWNKDRKHLECTLSTGGCPTSYN